MLDYATPEELAQYPPPPLPRWAERPDLYGFPNVKQPLLVKPSDQIVFRRPDKGNKQGEPYWISNYGPQTWGLVCPYQEIVVGGSRGGGKLSPLDSHVCTPKGFVRMGDVKVGDSVTDPVTGGSGKVIAVPPHPEMPIWKFTFDDGASLEVGEEHLWLCSVGGHADSVITTKEINGLFADGVGIDIPLTAPITFDLDIGQVIYPVPGDVGERTKLLFNIFGPSNQPHASKCAVPEAEAKWIQLLARSLGKKAIMTPADTGFFIVTLPNEQTRRRLISIDYVGKKEAQCITVSSPYGLYVADDFVVTHNSALLISWMVMGYKTLAPNDPAYYSAILDPTYRGLMVRREYKSMAELIDEAMEVYGPLGAKPKDDPVVFHFKSGAKIYTSHLGDKNAFEQFRGWGLSRIGVEELTQIEEERWYLKLLGSLRAKKQVRVHGFKNFPPLPSQIMSTTNPDGAGARWVKKRFIKVIGANGEYIPWGRPFRDPISGATRIFIPMARKENPFLRDNKEYEAMLLSQDEVTRQQWIGGSWEAASGVMFSEFRPHGPITAEEKEKYPWARHVIDPVELQPWWFRAGGGDWGYDHPAAFHKFCRSEKTGQIHAYDELKMRNVGSFEMGVKLAMWWLPDLEMLPDKSVTIAFSPDAFSKTDETRTKAEQIAAGINSILGPYGSFLMKYSDEEREAMKRDPNLASRMFERRRAEFAQGQMSIVLKPASTDTVARWSWLRELLRFRKVVQESEAQLRERLKAQFDKSGVEAYEKQLAQIKGRKEEILPRLLIWKGRCPGLVRCLEEALRDEDNPEKMKKFDAVEGVGGNDEIDSAGMGLHHIKEVEKTMPKAYFMSERLEEIQGQYERDLGERLTDPTRLVMVQQRQAARYDAQHPATGGQLYIPRASSGRHRQPVTRVQ